VAHRKNRKWYEKITSFATKRVVLWCIAGVVAILLSFQLAYPQDRGLPLATVGGRSMRLATHEDMANAIAEEFDESSMKLAVGKDKSISFALKTAGAEPNTELMIERLSGYPLWLRLIPGSIFWQPAQVTSADVYYAAKPFREFIETKVKELNFPPQNARLAIKDGKLTSDEAVEGSEINTAALLDVISASEVKIGAETTISVPAKRLKAERYSKDLVTVRKEAEAALTHTVTIQAGAKVFTPSRGEIASWILLDDAGGKVTLSVDRAKVTAYLNELNKEVATPAGQTDITIVDGRETGRTTGASGSAIDVGTVTDHIVASLLAPVKEVTVNAPFVEVQPSVIFNSRYTTTQEGLQAYVGDLARAKNVRISIQQLDGGKWAASARGSESTVSGSTYKLYVALVLFDKMAKGEIHWGDPMLDTTVAGCFERMTVASTNPCAEAWIAQFGRQYINDFIHARGFSEATTFTASDANRSSANDLMKYMIGLNDGSLVGGEYRDRLLDSLGRHPYRYGIPTGSKGIVHDKVGFIWDYVNDTAIVQHPRGTYVMAIMTKGYSYATIASITREVERIMYP
jgi:hypothetical protein